jgi:Pretoxin HINT domain
VVGARGVSRWGGARGRGRRWARRAGCRPRLGRGWRCQRSDSAGGGGRPAAADDASGGGGDPGEAGGPSGDGDPGNASNNDSANTGNGTGDDSGESCQLGGQSFSSSTGVLLADGKSVPISTLKVGDKVEAVDTKTGKNQTETVTAVLLHHDTDLYDLTVRSGGRTEVIHTTSSHLFWDPSLNYGWIPANHLKPSEKLKTPDGPPAVVVGGSVPAAHEGWMWDLTVPGDNDHDFYVIAGAPILVHNSGPCGIGNALRNWSSQRFQFGNEQFLLDKGDMTHILERHMPEYWDGSVKARQNFFDSSMSISDVQDAIGSVLGQNRDTLISRGAMDTYQIQGSYGGVDYVLGINNGHIGQFYPGALP